MDHRKREPVPGVFRLVLPLPFPGLDRVNAYLLTDDDASVLVDCGIYSPSEDSDHGWDELVAAVSACDVDIHDVKRLLITHPHIDHYGMAARLVDEVGCEVWMHKSADDDLAVYRDPKAVIERVRHTLSEHGVAADELEELTAFENWQPYVSGLVEATRKLEGGETFSCGGREWEVVWTPGHAHAHVCLWTARDSAFISGDHLLPAITPHIDYEDDRSDPLGDFLSSLEKVEDLAPDLVLPGHGRPFDDGAERARAIARHHDRRLGAILQVIRRKPASAREITDEIFGTTLLNFQRRLAMGEALAHLAYLEKRGEVERIAEGGRVLYQKVQRRPS
ncbi:MAG: MBL fold metallo-hydrolase [Actinomycetota bacterium]|nr:MBL fold metallo-hydrolase [Actinomycetota bacterium]